MATWQGDMLQGSWGFMGVTMPAGEAGYTGTLALERRGATWLLNWDISDGRYVGIGLAAGTHLYVGCGEHLAGLGLALIELAPPGAARVSWATAELGGATGAGALHLEAGALAGRHALSMWLPDGRAYGQWALAIRPAGPFYELEWLRGDALHWRGVGLPTPAGLAAAWYPDVRQLAVLDYTFDPLQADALSAVWALGGRAGLGTEQLRRMPPGGAVRT